MITEILNAAHQWRRYYASRGWLTFPAPPDGEKKSLKSKVYAADGANWGATADLDIIASDAAQWPDHNIGIVTGRESGVWVLDVDSKNGKDGFASLKAFEAEHGPLPATLMQRSPGGSLHYIFTMPDHGVKTSVSEIGEGLDVKGDGGMILAAPSNKPDVGQYSWVDIATPIAPAPDWLLALVKSPPAQEQRKAATPGRGTACPESTRRAIDWLRDNAALNDKDHLTIGMGLRDEFGDDPGLSIFTRLFGGIDSRGLARWNSFKPAGDDGSKAAIGSLRHLLREKGGPQIHDDISKQFERHSELMATMAGMPSPPIQPEPPGKLIQSGADFTRGFVPPSWLIKGVLQRRYCYALTAATGTGKTAIALRLAADVARGLSFGGHATKTGRVLYIAAENYVDVQGRWIGMAEFCGFDPDTIPVHFIAGEIKISEHWENIVREAQALGDFALIIVDTSAAVFEGEDENSNAQAREHAARMRALTTLPGGPTVLVLCHPTKQAKEGEALLPRGGGAFLAEVDGNLIAARKDGSVEVHTAGKFRGPDFAPILFRLETYYPGRLRDENGQPMPTVVARPLDAAAAEALSTASQDDERQLLDAIHRGAGALSLADLARGLGWLNGDGSPAKKKAERIGAALVRRGLAEKTIGGKLKCKSAGEKALNALDLAVKKSGQVTVPTPP